MNQNNRNIDLYGYIRKIVYKNNNVINFVFQDDSFGELNCKAGKETMLYRKAIKHKKYHLQTVIKGIPQIGKQGEELLYNHIYVKKANLL